MYLLFLDESGRLDQHTLFALGGVAVRDADRHQFRDAWHATMRAQHRPLHREVKSHGVRAGTVPPARADAVFGALKSAPVTAYVTLLDLELGRRAYPELFATGDNAYAPALMFLAERFQMLLEQEDDLGIIVADSRFRGEVARLRRFVADLTEDGTPCMTLSRIVKGLWDPAITRSACSAPT